MSAGTETFVRLLFFPTIALMVAYTGKSQPRVRLDKLKLNFLTRRQRLLDKLKEIFY